jgi:hypothetical protein
VLHRPLCLCFFFENAFDRAARSEQYMRRNALRLLRPTRTVVHIQTAARVSGVWNDESSTFLARPGGITPEIMHRHIGRTAAAGNSHPNRFQKRRCAHLTSAAHIASRGAEPSDASHCSRLINFMQSSNYLQFHREPEKHARHSSTTERTFISGDRP